MLEGSEIMNLPALGDGFAFWCGLFSGGNCFREINWQFNLKLVGVQTEVLVNCRPLLGLSLSPNQGRSGNQKNWCMLWPGSIVLPEGRGPFQLRYSILWWVRRDLLGGDSRKLRCVSTGPAVPFQCLSPALPHPSGTYFSSSLLCCSSICLWGQDFPQLLHICSSSSACPRCLLLSRAGIRRRAPSRCKVSHPSRRHSLSFWAKQHIWPLCFWQLWHTVLRALRCSVSPAH